MNEENKKDIEAEDMDEVKEIGKTEELEEVEEIGETEELDEVEEIGETEELDEAEEIDETEELNEAEEIDETEELNEAEEIDETEELDEAEEIDETEELDETEEIDEADGAEAIDEAEKFDDELDINAAVAEFARLIDEAEISGTADESFNDFSDGESDGEWQNEYNDSDEDEDIEEALLSAGSAKAMSTKKAMSLSAILVASIVVVGSIVFTAIFKKPTVRSTSGVTYGYVSDSQFVTDSDSVSIDDITDDVIGMGVLYNTADLYDDVDGNVTGQLAGGATLMIYEAKGDYYKVSDSESLATGYVLKEQVNTGGIDVGNPNPDLEIVDAETGEILDIIESSTKKETTTSASKTESTKKSETTTTKKDSKTTSATSNTTTTTVNGSTQKTTTTTKKTTTTTKSNTSGVNPEDFPVNSSPYFVYVEKGSHTITIYAKDSHGKYTTAVRTYLTATGRTSSLTPVGVFSIGGKEKWHRWGANSYSPYCSKYYGGLFFHGPIYKKQNFGSLTESSVSAIGTNASSGCMRTSAQAAYFIYAFCPSGTYVKIVNGSPLGKSASKPSISSQYVDPATNKVPVAGISMSSSSKTVKVGESFTINVNFEPSNASEKACYWVSSNTKVATVKSNNASCTITAKGAGTAVITATSVDGSYRATFTVTVTEVTTTTATTTTTTTATTTTTTKATEDNKSTTTTTKATESSKSTTSTTKATESSKSTTSTTKATESTKSTATTANTTEGTKSTTSTTKATESSKSTTTTTKATESTKSTAKTTTTTKATTTTTKATTTTTKATTTTTKAAATTTTAAE